MEKGEQYHALFQFQRTFQPGSYQPVTYNTKGNYTSVSGSLTIPGISLPAYNELVLVLTPGGGGGGTGGIVSGSTYTILARHSNKALDIAGGVTATADGANVQQWTVNGNTNQQWLLTDIGSGYYKLTAVSSGKALEVYNWYINDGANVQQNTYSGGANQQWSINSLGDGYYTVINRYSGKALDVYNSITTDGANADQWAYVGATNQQWQFTALSSARIAFKEEPISTQPYPNPFYDHVTIPVNLKQKAKVVVNLYSINGQLERTLYFKSLPAGAQQIQWDGADEKGIAVKPGVYVYQALVDGQTQSGKLVKTN
jgi:hypothetical protein